MAHDIKLRSRAYHRYFEGYEEREQCGENGSVVIRRYYTGQYYVQNISDRRRLWNRVVFVLLYIASWAAFLFAATRPVLCNIIWYVTIPSVGALVLSIVNGVYLFINVTTPRTMQIRSYRDAHQWFPAVSLYAGLCMIATSVTAAGSLLVNPDQIQMTLLCSGIYLIGGICDLIPYQVENKTDYTTRESDYPHRVMGSRIRYESDF